MSVEKLYKVKETFLVLDFMAWNALMAETFVPFTLKCGYVLPARQADWYLRFGQILDKFSVLRGAVSNPKCHFALSRGDLLNRRFDRAYIGKSMSVTWSVFKSFVNRVASSCINIVMYMLICVLKIVQNFDSIIYIKQLLRKVIFIFLPISTVFGPRNWLGFRFHFDFWLQWILKLSFKSDGNKDASGSKWCQKFEPLDYNNGQLLLETLKKFKRIMA